MCEFGVDMNKRSEELGLGPLQIVFLCRWSSESSAEIIRLLALLLEYGADPCALTGRGWPTVFLAYRLGWLREFETALVLCEMDPIAVFDEGERRLKQYHGGIADSSALDELFLCRPFSEGLSLRRARRGDRLDD